ncbi:PQQ-dependent sugar dehydrogenase [Roseiarcaceae bacterium H3SJ34-1]|uniref:PQQ-dependent sugar dehydrogenase n=1 Tax=Terripilifer ovatus TaxID=3032367 RepID=UPI003AB95C47|nr:PQQ-dependent sugar dehydrogenase [Roseiarcaceae bacterium H3SJ34-1]
MLMSAMHFRFAALLAAGLVMAPGIASAQQPAVPDVAKQAERSKQSPNLRGVPISPIAAGADKLPISRFKLPPGFSVEVWQAGIAGARTMLLGPKGTMFVGTQGLGRVYAIVTRDGKHEVKTIAHGLNMPNGLAMKDGALIVVANKNVYRFDNIEDNLDNPKPVDISEKFNLPGDRSHGWRYVAFGPDGKLYIPVGAPCNICEPNYNTHSHIRRYDADGANMEIIAKGVRNTVGFDWHPVTGELWFTDNGRDWAGNEGPEDEFNRLPKGKEGAFFGFPYCHANGIADPDIKRPDACKDVILPAVTTGPHSASLGVHWYTGDMFPAEYKNAAFIARRGSWNRDRKFGSDLAVVRVAGNGMGKATLTPFMTGLLDEQRNEHMVRLVLPYQMPDGSLLVSDEQNGAIYRITYKSQRAAVTQH